MSASVDRLRELRLGGYAYAACPAGSPGRAALRGEYLAALARHHRIRGDVLPLLRAWREAGIELLLFKGFALAELAYPAPGMRFHGDVDVVVREGDERAAVGIAREMGWLVKADSHATGRTSWHGVADLAHPGGETQVDLQRFVAHSFGRWPRRQRRLTRAVWDRARVVRWEGLDVRILDDVDAIVVLALHRAWGDSWGVKPHDPLDIRVLADRIGGGWRRAVDLRARELGCARTVARFVDRCDGSRGAVPLGTPSRRERLRHEAAIAVEHPRWWTARRLRGAAQVLPALADVPVGLARVLRARRALGRHGDIGALLAAVTPRETRPRRATEGRRIRTVRGIRWAMRFVRGDRYGRCLIRSLAIYETLRRDGWPVQLVTGVRRTTDGIVGHAWVRCDGTVLPELGEPDVERLYAVNLCFPPCDRADV